MSIFTSIAIAIGSLVGASATSFFVTATAWALKTIAGIGLNLLLAPKAPKPPQFSIEGTIRSGEDVPRSFLIGWRATRGSLVYANTWGSLKKTPNAYMSQVVAVSDLPIQDMVRVVIDGNVGTLEKDREDPLKGWPVKEYSRDGTDYAWVKFYNGTQTVADPLLVNHVSSPEHPYAADRIGRGVAYFILTTRIAETLFTGIPDVMGEFIGIPTYDITKDTTQGGSGAQRWGTPSTWGGDGDHLVAAQLYTIMRGLYWNGKWFYGLQNTEPARLPAADWRAAVEVCRTPVDGPSGTQPMYRAGAEIPVSASIADTVDTLLAAAGARLAEDGGAYYPFFGPPPAPSFSLSDDDIIVSHEQIFTPFRPLEDTINGATGRYPSPDDLWESKDSPPIYRTDLEAAVGGRRLLTDVSLDMVPYPDQVQRVMDAAIKEAQRERRHTLVLPPEYFGVTPGMVGAYTSPDNGYVAKRFRVEGKQDLPDSDVLLDLIEIDPSDYNWNFNTDYIPVLPSHPGTRFPPIQEVDEWAAIPDAMFDASNNSRRPTIRVELPGDLDDVRAVRVVVRLASTSIIIYDMELPYGNPATNPATMSYRLNGVFLPNTIYQIAIQLMPRGVRETVLTPWRLITTLDIKIGEVDILDGSITSAKIADSAVTANKIMNEAVSSIKLANQAVTTAKLALAAVTQDIIDNNAVVSAKLADLAVTEAKVAANAITTTKIANNAINEGKIAANAVTSAKIAEKAITIAKFADGIQPVGIVSGSVVPTVKSTEMITVAGNIYRWNGTAYDKGVAAVDLVGQITEAQIGANAVTSTKIADNSISTPKLQANSVVSDKIAANAVTAIKIAANSIESDKIAANAVTSDKIMANSVTSDKIVANAITTAKIAAGAVTTTELAARSVVASKMLISNFDNLIYNSDFGTGDLAGWYPTTGSSVAVEAVASAPAPNVLRVNPNGATVGVFASDSHWTLPGAGISVNAGESYRFAVDYRTDGTVGGIPRILAYYFNASGSAGSAAPIILPATQASWATFSGEFVAPANIVRMLLYIYWTGSSGGSLLLTNLRVTRMSTSELIVDGAITALKVAAGAITTDKLEANSVTTAKIATGAVTANEVAANAITTAKLAAGAVTATEIGAGAVIAGKIAANAVTTATIAAGAVTANEIATNAITAVKILAGAITGEKIAASSITGDKMVANTITARELVLVDFENLILDGSFNSGTAAGWSALPTGMTIGTADAAMPTEYYLQIAGTTTIAVYMDTAGPGTRTPVKAGESFSIQFDARQVSGTASRILVGITWFDKAGAALTTSWVYADNLTSTTVKTISGSVAAPLNAVSLRTTIRRNDASTGNTRVTNIYIRRRKGAELIVDGAITADKLAANSVSAAKIQAGAINVTHITASKLDAAAVLQNGSLITDILAFDAVTEWYPLQWSRLISKPPLTGAGHSDGDWVKVMTVVVGDEWATRPRIEFMNIRSKAYKTGGNGNYSNIDLYTRIMRNGVQILSQRLQGQSTGIFASSSSFTAQQDGAATYELFVWHDSAGQPNVQWLFEVVVDSGILVWKR